ncbi:MAG TPA: type II restriction endonuclease, partial [Gemmatimonas sp.]|uniref:type II restriction endonuclease n=1 Tax=Gemmatimonas sp. TaxID=1962908 RepID=UPI002ED7BCC6
ARRLLEGFVHLDGTADVDAFRTFSMALRQSRVSRAGGALQYHMETLLREWAIPYVMEPTIDGGESPDFLFPSAKAYTDASFPAANLRMLAAKYTAKDRWRQVLNEAERIPQKHLLTLEPAISKGQLSLMQRASLTPVIPAPIRNKYADDARGGILTVQGFIDELRSVQTQWS